MSKQLILITAPFDCGHCTKAVNELPSVCEERGWEFIEMKNEKTDNPEDDLPVDMYPTIMFRVNEEIKHVVRGYNSKNVLNEIKKY
mgnify:CR=1 FL=1